MLTAAEEAAKLLYKKGVTDGMEIAYSLLLGRRVNGGETYKGRLELGAAEWAMENLAAIHALKRRAA